MRATASVAAAVFLAVAEMLLYDPRHWGMAPIPNHRLDGTLPAFTGHPAANDAGRAPYATTIDELVARYATSDRRRELLRGLLGLRAELRALKITDAFHWIDGSFVNVLAGREPGDIDVVTFFTLPPSFADPAIVSAVLATHQHVFNSSEAKKRFGCEAFYVQLNADPVGLVRLSRYWYSLFAHERGSLHWRGFLEIPLGSDADDVAAQAVLKPKAAPHV